MTGVKATCVTGVQQVPDRHGQPIRMPSGKRLWRVTAAFDGQPVGMAVHAVSRPTVVVFEVDENYVGECVLADGTRHLCYPLATGRTTKWLVNDKENNE